MTSNLVLYLCEGTFLLALASVIVTVALSGGKK